MEKENQRKVKLCQFRNGSISSWRLCHGTAKIPHQCGISIPWAFLTVSTNYSHYLISKGPAVNQCIQSVTLPCKNVPWCFGTVPITWTRGSQSSAPLRHGLQAGKTKVIGIIWILVRNCLFSKQEDLLALFHLEKLISLERSWPYNLYQVCN